MNLIKIKAPASKSYMQRALAISALVEGKSILKNVSWCDDSLATKSIIENLGAKTVQENDDLKIIQEKFYIKNTNFSAGESGLALRMFSPVLALSNKQVIFSGIGSLKNRPVNFITETLLQLGAKIESNKGYLPLTIKGKIKAANITTNGSISSQLLTGLLISLPLLDGDSTIFVKNLKSTPYIDMTLSIMKHFGVEIEHYDYKEFKIKGNQKYKATKYDIEGDWSGAAFLLITGAVKSGIEIENLRINSLQADKEIVGVLKKTGAKVIIKENSIIVEPAKLQAFEFDASNCPDLFPPLVALATKCVGTSIIKGVSRLKYKESNRGEVLKNEMEKVGINVIIKDDFMHISGNKLKSGIIDSHNDHRIAMLTGVLDLFTDEKIIATNLEVVKKSYPNFFKDIANCNFYES